MKNVLFLSIKPRDKENLNLYDELKVINEKLNPSIFSVIERTSVYTYELIDILKKCKPNIVHFSGHREEHGLFLLNENDEAELVDFEKISNALELFESVECVIFNVCHSCKQAEDASKYVKYSIGMNGRISDKAALSFSAGFYTGIDYGKNYKKAFKFGTSQIGLQRDIQQEEDTPRFFTKKEIVISEKKENIILLIGAGFSKYLGLPGLDDLLQRATLGEDHQAEIIRKTRNIIQSYKRQKKAVFEEIISKLRYYQDISELLRRDSTFREELAGSLPYKVDNGGLEKSWRDALTRCYRILVQEYGPNGIKPNSNSFNNSLNFFKELAWLNSNHLDIYTTNYDCSFQVLAANCNYLNFFTHIDSKKGYFCDKWHESKLNNPSCPSIYIHRFHGCISWFSDIRKPFCVVEEVYGSGGGESDLKVEDDEYLHGMAIKLTSAQSVGTNPAFSLSFEEFSSHLKEAKILLVWGYSFRDLEILRYINQAFLQKSLSDVIYIYPYMTEEGALRNLKDTLSNAPILIDPEFKPKKIDWKTCDKYEQLIEKTLNKINGILSVI